jgi:hypothetical protein
MNRRTRQANQPQQIGFGYVIIPNGIDRTRYVESCFNKERVSIVQENGSGIIKDCYIDRDKIKSLEFPTEKNILGNLVCYVTDSFHSKPIIIAVVSKESETQLLKEGKFQLKKEQGSNAVEISGSVADGVLNISVNNVNEYGVININVAGKTGGKVNISSTGEVTLTADEKVSVKARKEANIKVLDIDSGDVSEVKVTPTEIHLLPKNKLSVFSGSSPMVLGDELLEQLEVLQNNIDLIITAIKNGVPLAGDGGVAYKTSMVSIIDLVKQESDFSKVNSDKSFLE